MKIIYTLNMKFTEVSVCCECGEITREITSGDEGWTFCPGCEIIEGKTQYMFECSQCLAMCEDEKCECCKPQLNN